MYVQAVWILKNIYVPETSVFDNFRAVRFGKPPEIEKLVKYSTRTFAGVIET